jgi:hypothetical protein
MTINIQFKLLAAQVADKLALLVQNNHRRLNEFRAYANYILGSCRRSIGWLLRARGPSATQKTKQGGANNCTGALTYEHNNPLLLLRLRW